MKQPILYLIARDGSLLSPSLWQKAMKLQYVPIVHIEAVKYKKRNQKKEVTAIQAAIQETAEYSVKDADYLTGDLESDLEEGLYRKRIVSYGGLLKEVHKALNLDDEESDVEEKAYSIVAQWNWGMRNYVIR